VFEGEFPQFRRVGGGISPIQGVSEGEFPQFRGCRRGNFPLNN